jgi:radical SAM superfamily enzyme YgiQ (UPF0313 family)
MRILLVTPPMTQLNTPYPATAYLTGFLRARGYDVRQADPALELVLRLFSRTGLTAVRAELAARYGARKQGVPASVSHFLQHADRYIATIEPIIAFLQGQDPSLALRLAGRQYAPEGPRFRALTQFGTDADEQLEWAFGAIGIADRAKYIATLVVDDLADVIKDGLDPRFSLSRYGEKLAASAPSFDPLAAALAAAPTLIDRLLDDVTRELVTQHEPDVLGLTVPFPGNVYGALRMARTAKALKPAITTMMGGGYVNTELRSLAEPRLFDHVDFVTLDDGEAPFLRVLELKQKLRGEATLLRTFVRRDGAVRLISDTSAHDIPFKDAGTPTYDGLPLGRYLSLLEMLNPMHRIWSDGRWNKLTLAHGCYWKKCNFCDVSLDYIGRYEEQAADLIVDKMEAMIAATGQRGFHFVDEAAPPKVLFALADRILARGLTVTWWGNIRFEKTFTPELCKKLAAAGCVAVSGGLEVASDRLLKLMNKGVTVEQVARVAAAFSDAGVMVHAYLMYGFPTQTEQETIDALERVRQLFAAGIVHSAYWHRFSATIHSPIGKAPGDFGIKIVPKSVPVTFAENDLDFEDPTGVDHDALGQGLARALFNYMHGAGLDLDVRQWFDQTTPKARVPKNLVAAALSGGRQGARSERHV